MGWSDKYKKSIDCNNPKGFSQKAHCQGRKKRNESKMNISQLKEEIRSIVRERALQQEARKRGIKTIQKDLDNNAKDIQKALDFYKKNKNTDKAKAFIEVLKKLNKKKQELTSEFDKKVSTIDRSYADATMGSGIDTTIDIMGEASSEPQIISQLRDIVKNKQNQSLKDPKSGKKMRVDLYSANIITQVYDAIKSQSTKEKFLSGGLLGMQNMAFKVTKR